MDANLRLAVRASCRKGIAVGVVIGFSWLFGAVLGFSHSGTIQWDFQRINIYISLIEKKVNT